VFAQTVLLLDWVFSGFFGGLFPGSDDQSV